jgi:toxin ParE1/3/4
MGERVRKTALAESDLEDVWFYIALDNPSAADGVLDAIARDAALYAHQPLMGRRRDELMRGLRSFPVGRYIVYYLPQPDGIEIVRVLDAARDVDSIAGAGGFG